MEAEEAAPLFQQIITKPKFEDNVDEITFPAPVCLKGIAVGAMPGSIPDGGHAFLNVFARDSRAGGSARFACLYEGLQQPTAGVSVVHIQPFITDHVVLHGRYQTAPITLLGVPLAEAAAQYVPRPETPVIDLEQALPRFEKLVECLPPQPVLFDQQQDQQQDHAGKTSANVSFYKDARQGLEGLLKFWRKVGSSYRRISEATIPKAAFTKAIKAADALCEKLAMDRNSGLVIFEDKDSRTLSIDESELIDMAMGWAGLLADIPIPLAANASISECSSAGIAALLLICTLPSAATTLLARHGHLLLADVFKITPIAPGSQLRHATAACLLIALSNGGAGCEALLGWWSPSFVQWVAPSKKNNPTEDDEKERRHHHRDDSREKHSRREKQRDAIIPQVDGAGDEKKRGWHHNKRQRRDESHDRDDLQQHRRGGGRNNDGRSHHHHHRHRDNSSGAGGRGGGRWQAIEDDDRWDGGGGGDADEYIAHVEEDDEDTKDNRRRERDDARDEERRGGGEERRRDDHHHHRGGSGGGKERSRDRSTERERGAEHDRERGRERERVPITARLGKRINQSPPPTARRVSPSAVEEKKRNPRGRDDHHHQPEKKKDDLRHQIRASALARPSPPPSTSRGRSPLRKQPPLKRNGKHEQEDVAILHKFTQYWDNRLRHYVGLYSPLATLLFQIQPRTLTVIGTRLMRILRFYEHVTIFSNAAEELTSQYLPSKRSCMPSKEAAVLARKCGAALAGMAEYMAQGNVDASTSGLNSGLSGGLGLKNENSRNSGIHGVNTSAQSTNIVHITTLINLMTSRRVHQLLAALVLVPATHKARSEEEGGDAAMTAADASAAMSIELSLGYRPFLSAITSNVVSFSRSEIRGLVSELLRVLCLPGALDTSLSSALAPLAYFAVALAAVEDLHSSSISSTKFSSAATTLGQLFAGGPSHRTPAVHAVCLNAAKVLPKLVEGVIQRCAVLLEAAGMAAPVKKEKVDQVDDDSDMFGKVLDALPCLEICTDILLAVLKECTSIHVVSALASLAEPMISSLSVAAQDLCGCPVAGAAAVFNAVESICGGFEALSTLQNSIHTVISKENSSNVVESMLTALATDLPTLAPLRVEHFLSCNSPDVDDIHNGGSSMYVDWADIRDFWDNPRRKYRAELSLKLLTMFLWQPTTSITTKAVVVGVTGDSGGDNNSGEDNNNKESGSTVDAVVYGRHAAATMQSHDGQRLLLRALVTAGEATAASYSDRQWISRAGAAIDPATAASNKQAALEFLSSTAAMASVFFQHMREMMPIHSTACAAALIEAHAVVSSEEDCLLALLGQANAAACGTAALTARFHLTSALRCWIESSFPSASNDSPWTPELLPLILFGTNHAKRCLKHGVLALPPRQLFTAVCILGDLSPTEWPPAGTRRLFNPPPSFRPYRGAFAKAIEKCSVPFSELISACVNAEPTLLRAAAARMLARAAGFGGGMGEFIIKPILDALQLGTASQTPAHDVRKVLELLVPLVYRPALKAALLDSLAPAILAEVLRVMLTGYPFGATSPVPIDPTDASAICTMVLECLVVLCNPQHMLDPQIQPDNAAMDDTLRVEQGKIISSVLLEFLSSFGVNIPLAHRVLRLLAENACGRISICRGAAALHAKATQKMDSRASAAEIVAAAQWVATRYWEMAQQAQHDATVSETYADVLKIMTTIIESMEEDGMVEQVQQRRQQKQELQANKRFVAATYNSIAAATAAGVDLSAFEHRWEKEIPDPISSAAIIPFESSTSTNSTTTSAAAAAAGDLAIASGVFDPATRMFWTNYRARAVQQTRASTEMVLRKFHRKTCLPDEYFTLADTLHLPLTRPMRPLHEDMEADQEADDEDDGVDGGATLEEDTGPSEMLQNEEIKEEEEEERVEIKNETSPLPVVPIVPSVNVPVIAPPTAPAADFDLYADLGADLGIGGGAAVVAPKTEPSASGPTSPVADDPSALLNDPEALKAVLKDPAKMQELLQRNPALLMAMKSKFGKGGDAAK